MLLPDEAAGNRLALEPCYHRLCMVESMGYDPAENVSNKPVNFLIKKKTRKEKSHHGAEA